MDVIVGPNVVHTTILFRRNKIWRRARVTL
jgi:hypothetical protein